MVKVNFNHSDKLNKVCMMVVCGATNAGKTHFVYSYQSLNTTSLQETNTHTHTHTHTHR